MKARPYVVGNRDDNEPDIIKALTEVGAVVVQLEHPADLLVGSRGRWYLLEVKDGNKPPSRRKLTDNQIVFSKRCQIDRLPFAVVMTPIEALKAIGIIYEGIVDKQKARD